MEYTVVTEYIDLNAVRSDPAYVPKVLTDFSNHANIEKALDKITTADICQFVGEVAMKKGLPRHILSAGIVGPEMQVIAHMRTLEGFENIMIPPGVYLQFDRSKFSVEDFERKSGFPISAYKSYGANNDYYLLKEIAVLKNEKEESIIRKHYGSARKVKNDDKSLGKKQ